MGNEADQDCASFLNELRPQTLRSFCVFGRSTLSIETFLAINCHSATLSRLELQSIGAESMQHLSKLKDCTNIRTLYLAEDERPTQDLEHTYHDAFLDMVEWLRKCKKLKAITFAKFISAPAILAHLFREPGMAIESLCLSDCSLSENKDFLPALALQMSLKSLVLQGDDSESESDNNALVQSLTGLINLTYLHLGQISAWFTEHHIAQLTASLGKLQTFWTGGYHITDNIWDDFKRLQYLQRLDLNADTRFSFHGIYDYISSLDERSKQGFVLSIMMQDTDCDISERDLASIQTQVKSRLGGEFNFLLVRAPEEEDFSDDDSD